ncbi:MAG: hypothetical protein H0X43_12850 [Nitrosospira sp.]|nr:hypothetical protein [Nitrosospira sp.]
MKTRSDYSHIQGWGADLDPKGRPAYPKERIPARLSGVHWDHPEQQEQKIEILRSIERPNITPVFGTSTPPSGLSGTMRETAFRFSENDIRHWLLLLFADRINVCEGLLDDVKRGHIPNIFHEMGWKSELKYNRADAIRKLAIGSVLLGSAIYLIKRKKRQESG